MERLSRPYTQLKATTAFLLVLGIATSASTANAAIAQSPLLLGGGNVPGNLALVPSVEWPTVLSIANVGDYTSAKSYVGYFDSQKCYRYEKNNEWFDPVRTTTDKKCTAEYEWSGNFLNWALTPTIDPFRSALTGGYRHKDEAGLTVLQKARHDGSNEAGNRFGKVPISEISGAAPLFMGATGNENPWSTMNIRLAGLGSDVLISTWTDKIGTNTGKNEGPTEWIDLKDTLKSENLAQYWINGKLKRANDIGPNAKPSNTQVKSVYRFKARVKVCAPSLLEKNCKKYSESNYKPEGLIQQYSSQLRYSAFGYLNDGNYLRDGGVLRAAQKFVGPEMVTVGQAGEQPNPRKEWDPNTGIFTANPDNITSSLGVAISNSGVINYINKFGELTDNKHKSYDPVSELYYSALRYFKAQGNVPSYTTTSPSHNSSPNDATIMRWVDGFPVITNWDGLDPIQYSCQKNVILGIGDVNTHRDKNLPGSAHANEEPSMPTEVSSDKTVDVTKATAKVASLEGISINNSNFRGADGNSAFIAGLAYDAHTVDIRPDKSGKQTISTYWVDVMEDQKLRPSYQNQYWLAAKYGGFEVPKDFDPYASTANSSTLPLSSWWTNQETLEAQIRNTNPEETVIEKRPDNFFTAGDASNMIESLKKAFAQIANEVQSTTTSLASNSTRLSTDTAVFQSRLDSNLWSGDLLAKKVDNNGAVSDEAVWSAAERLDNLSSAAISARNILTVSSATITGGDDEQIASEGLDFEWEPLKIDQKEMLKTSENDTFGESRLNYLRGDRTNEISVDDRTKRFRQRGSRLGDIVNSDPQYIHNQDFGYSRLSWSNGSVGDKYIDFRQSIKDRVPLIVVGANDGMLHGFNANIEDAANGGKELFAFVPNAIFPNLKHLSDPAYSHRYYVDGTPRVGDAWDGTKWRTLAIGATGAGGKSVFALDISDPENVTKSSVLWEFTHPKMGYTLGQPALVALPDEKFGVIISSGYHDTEQEDRTGYVWVLDAATGSILMEAELPTTGNLGGPLAADTNYDQVVDRVYVGDTLGNLWRLDLTSNKLGFVSGLKDKPLFKAVRNGSAQAITAPLSSAFNEKNEHMVFFGTGSFYRNGDNEIPDNPNVETFYGVIDNGEPVARNNLLKQVITKEQISESGDRLRAISNNTLTSEKGWYLDLAWLDGEGASGAEGERVISKAVLRGDRVVYTTMTPSADPCAFGGTSVTMAMNLSSGSRLNYVYFDSDGDGDLDGDDTVTGGDADGDPWSGISDDADGVIKGAIPKYKWLCYAGSSGQPKCIPVAGSQRFGRNSWRELRTN